MTPSPVYNLDIDPTEEMKALFPALKPIFADNRLRNAFHGYEAAAGRAKREYWFYTRLAVISIGLGVFSAAAVWLFSDDISPVHLKLLGGITGFIGVLGIGLEVYLLVKNTKGRWLINRFAAELIRSYTAQLYAFGACATSRQHLENQVEFYIKERLEGLRDLLNSGHAAYRRFELYREVVLPEPIKNPDSEIFEQCRMAYEKLRVRFQYNFVRGELGALEDTKKIQDAGSDFVFIIAAVATVSGLVMPFFINEGGQSQTLNFVALAGVFLFFVSALTSIMGFGSLAHAGYGRYAAYAYLIDSLPANDKDAPAEFLERVRLIEVEALRELDAFCLQIESVKIRL